MDKRKLMLPLALFVVLLGISTSAMADTLNVTNGFTTCPAGGCASVTLTQVDSNTVEITVTSLLNGYQFNNFGFSFSGSGTLALDNATGALGSKYDLSGPDSYNLSGFGKFEYLFDTDIHGGSTGSACQNGGAGCTFRIFLSGTSDFTVNNLRVLSTGNAGDGNVGFAGHIASSTCTGFVGGPGNTNATDGEESGCGGTNVPEPASLTLLSAGLVAAGFMVRRKLRQ